jgi:hypothetical protein
MGATLGESIAILGTIDPKDLATSAVNSDYCDCAKYGKVSAFILIGAITGTIDAKLQQASDSSGTGVKDITGKSITQLAATDDNKQAVISVDVSELDLANDFTHVRCVVTPTGGTTNFGGVAMLGGDARFSPVDSHDLSTVAEIVN